MPVRRRSSRVTPLLLTKIVSPQLLRGGPVFILLPALLKMLLGAPVFASSLAQGIRPGVLLSTITLLLSTAVERKKVVNCNAAYKSA